MNQAFYFAGAFEKNAKLLEVWIRHLRGSSEMSDTDLSKSDPVNGLTQEDYAQILQETRGGPPHIIGGKRRHYASSSEVLLICLMDGGHASIKFDREMRMNRTRRRVSSGRSGRVEVLTDKCLNPKLVSLVADTPMMFIP